MAEINTRENMSPYQVNCLNILTFDELYIILFLLHHNAFWLVHTRASSHLALQVPQTLHDLLYLWYYW